VSGKNCNSTFLYPYHLQAGHAHLAELKLKYDEANQRYLACVVPANKTLILSNVHMKVAGQLLGVFQILV
jgi:hypothetical protein